MDYCGTHLASDVAMALSDGINGLHALLQWIDAGAASIEALAIDRSTFDSTMKELEWAMTELLKGGRVQGGPQIKEADIASVSRLRALFSDWLSSGEMSTELGVVAHQCMNALVGANSRDIFKDRMRP
jgi:hypothetical protein